MDELNADHSDLVEVLLRKTRYQQRREERNLEYMKSKFVDSWNKFKLPKLT